jgi:Glycosyl hydrolases family 18
MPWTKTANVAMFEGADWSSFSKVVGNCSPPQAQRIAMRDPTIRFFFVCREPMVLTNPAWPQPRTFAPGDAVFFTGEPWWGSAPQCDGYQKDGLSIAYIDGLTAADPASPLIAGHYVTAQGLNAVDIVCLFAANLCTSATGDYVRLAPNVPVPANGTLAIAHDYYIAVFERSVAALQEQGICVLLSFLNNWDAAGWSEFATPQDAEAFAAQLNSVVDSYGFDGIDIDNEYSSGIWQPNALAMVTSMIRQAMPDIILSKALWHDISPFPDDFDGRYDDVGLAQTLTYGWEMSYGNDPAGILPQYAAKGMAPEALAYGFQAPSGDPSGSIGWLKGNGYGGSMVYPFEKPDNQALMGSLVNGWMGPGNWNKTV